MKLCLYAGDMNLNKNDEKKVCRNTKKLIFKKQNSENFFVVQMFYSPISCLASIMF